MSENKSKKNNIRKYVKNSLVYDLEIERNLEKELKNSGYDFVPRIDQWMSIDEQKIKTEKLENITKKQKNS